MLNTNFPKSFASVSVSKNTVVGVRESYMQSRFSKPVEATVLPRLSLDNFPKSQAKIVYVAPYGNDKSPGSESSPYATVSHALSEVSGGGAIILDSGTYILTESINIGTHESGSKDAPVFIMAKKDTTPVLTTGRVIPTNALIRAEAAAFITPNDIERLNRFIPDNAKNILVANLAELGFTSEDLAPYRSGQTDPCLLIDDRNCIVARWPNVGAFDDEYKIQNGSVQTISSPQGMNHIRKVGNVRAGISSLYYEHKDEVGGWEIYIDDALYSNRISLYDTEASKLWMYGSVYEEWDNHRFRLHLEKDENGRSYMRSETPAYYGAKENSGNHLFFYNILEELDSEDEFLIDPDRMLLFIYARETLDGHTLTLTISEAPLFNLCHASNIVIDGLKLCRSSGHGICAKECDNLVIQACSFDGLYNNSILLSDCTNSAVTYCDFVRSYGVLLEAPRLTREFLPTVNAVQNNRFRNAGEVAARQNGIMFSGVGDIISHNYFYETILYVGRALDAIIEYNRMERGSQHVRDNGPIYTNDDSRGVHIRHNLLYNINHSMYGIYLDDFSSGLYVYGNIIHYSENMAKGGRCINLHNGNMNVVENNICIGSTTAAILNNINYYAKTVNGKPTGGGSLGYRWESIAKQRLTANYHRSDKAKMAACYPMYKWFIEIVDSTIDKMNPDQGWKHSEKFSPVDDEELFTRMPSFNIYEKNVFYACASGLEIPEVGKDSCFISDNISYPKGTDVGFADLENGIFEICTDSIILRDIPGFVRPDFKKMGLTYTQCN